MVRIQSPPAVSRQTIGSSAAAREEIYRGLKRKFEMAELITGRELCDLFRIEYDSIVKHRQKDQRANLEYIARELLSIDGIRAIVLKSIEGVQRDTLANRRFVGARLHGHADTNT